MKQFILFVLAAVIFLPACKNKTENVNADFEKQLQLQFINAKDGDIIELPEGTYTLNRSLVLDKVKNITIKGKGIDKTILSFKGQKDGAEGLRVTADGVVMEDFSILDPKGDCIKVQDATNVTFRRLKVGWASVHDPKNGSYGTYPVGCTNVLIEDCEVFGASDAGVYVGQCKNVVVRSNHVHDNVAGIEIENCTDAQVTENLSEGNTGGILVFKLPELPKKSSLRCKIANNKIINNNAPNFGVKGTTVAEIPAGTGIIAMATNYCDIEHNVISGQNTIGIAIVSYLSLEKPFKDSLYDPYSGGVSVHDNTITRGTGGPDNTVTFGQLFIGIFGDKIPDIVYDGEVNPTYLNNDGTLKEDMKICIHGNGNVTFSDLDMEHKGKDRSSDASKFDCTLAPLGEVTLNQ